MEATHDLSLPVWRTEGRAEVSEDGWIIHPLHGGFELFLRPPHGPPISHGLFVSAAEARAETGWTGRLALQARLGTGAPGHTVRGGYDVDVARRLADDLPEEVVTATRVLDPSGDDVPDVIVVPVQVVYPGHARLLPRLLVGARAAELQRRETGRVMGRALPFELAELARIPDAGEHDPRGRAALRRALWAAFTTGGRSGRAGR